MIAILLSAAFWRETGTPDRGGIVNAVLLFARGGVEHVTEDSVGVVQ